MHWSEYYKGIFIGLIVSLITYLLTWLFPILRSALSREAKLPKQWQWFDGTNSDPVGSLTIKQTGSLIRGELIRNTSTAGEKETRRFKLKGKFYCDKITALYEELDNPRLVSGAIVLKLRSNREYFYGRTLFLHHDSGKVVSPKFIFAQSETLPKLGQEYLELMESQDDEGNNGKTT